MFGGGERSIYILGSGLRLRLLACNKLECIVYQNSILVDLEIILKRTTFVLQVLKLGWDVYLSR